MQKRNQIYNNRRDITLIITLVIVQFLFWNGIRFGEEGNETIIWKGSHVIKPNLAIVPEPPTETEVKALSWGDEEFYFRMSALSIQNAGDTFGRTTSLTDYNYEKLYKWWKILDSLNSVSNFVPPLVSYYFGASQEHKKDIPYVVKYLTEYADMNPSKNWWWYGQAVFHAKHKMEDLDLALEIAEKMSNIPSDVKTPLWVRQMPAFILESKGEYNASCEIILNILENYKNIKEGELNFMIHFIQQRITELVTSSERTLDTLTPKCRAFVEAQQQDIKDKHRNNSK